MKCTFIKDELKDWAGADPFAAALNQHGKIFREKEGRRTLRFTHKDKNYFLKLHIGVGWREIIKNALQLRAAATSAQPEWRSINKLRTANISTMDIIGYGSRGINPAKRLSFLITAELKNVISLEDLSGRWINQRPTFATKYKILHQTATAARAMHDLGINHRDFYLCHLFVNQDWANATPPDVCDVVIMDLHRAQIRKRVPRRWLIKDLGALCFSCMESGFKQRDFYRFIKIYSRSNLRTALRQQSFWAAVKTRADRMQRHMAQQRN